MSAPKITNEGTMYIRADIADSHRRQAEMLADRVRELEARLEKAREFAESTRRQHTYCEDNYHSCPQHEDSPWYGDGRPCDCGADAFNNRLNAFLTTF